MISQITGLVRLSNHVTRVTAQIKGSTMLSSIDRNCGEPFPRLIMFKVRHTGYPWRTRCSKIVRLDSGSDVHTLMDLCHKRYKLPRTYRQLVMSGLTSAVPSVGFVQRGKHFYLRCQIAAKKAWRRIHPDCGSMVSLGKHPSLNLLQAQLF